MSWDLQDIIAISVDGQAGGHFKNDEVCWWPFENVMMEKL